MTYLDQIIISIIVSVMGADGVDDYKVTLVDGPVYSFCASSTACSRIYDDHIFIDVNKLHKKDSCGRTPFQHELAHFVYYDTDIDIHKVCTKKIQIIDWRYSEYYD
jgi:hypothetical protein